MSLTSISLCAAGSIFLFVIAFNAKVRTGDIRYGRKEEYIWENWTETVYTLLFGNKAPEKVCKALGLEYDKYMMNCDIIGKKPDFQKEAANRVVGVFSFVFGIILTILLRNAIPIIVGIVLYYLLAAGVAKKVERQAQTKKAQLSNDIVRFTDLLLSALSINLPIDVALLTTANNMPCVLSDELKLSFAETQIGAKDWQKALEDIARKYEIDIFSDFVLDIVTAYNKGISIKDAVERKNVEIKQAQIFNAKEQTSKMTTTILAPITFFKLIPLLAIMLMPIIIQITTTF